jgi:hypothetical protein
VKKRPKYPLTKNQREELFNERGGICMHCEGTIDRVHEKWHVCHGYKDGLARSCGGSDEWDNLSPGHKACNLGHAAKVEVKMAAKIKRVRHRHYGNRSEPKVAPLKRKMDGTVMRFNPETGRHDIVAWPRQDTT